MYCPFKMKNNKNIGNKEYPNDICIIHNKYILKSTHFLHSQLYCKHNLV